MFNFAGISKSMREAEALQQVENVEQLATAVIDLLSHPETRQTMGEQGKKLVEENRGSLERLLGLVRPYIEKSQNRSVETT